jgi:ubiquinone biosynthesis protein UbiJ
VINQTACSAINHLLSGEDWARARLAPHAGKTVTLTIGGVDFRFVVLDTGMLAEPAAAVEGGSAAEPASATLTITMSAGSLLAAARREEGALKNVEVRGDADLAQAVMFLVANLRWDVEEDLARLIGDIAAHRMVSETKNLFAWEADARARFAKSAGEYLTGEAAVLADAASVDGFLSGVDRLRDDTARLEKRIAALATGNTGRKAR